MSRLIQASNRRDLIPQEHKLRITQWKFLKERYEGIEVCVGYDVFLIHDISLWTFHNINSIHIDKMEVFDYLRSALICSRCGGTGIVDWINKATPSKKSDSIFLDDVMKYVRNKKGPVNVLSDFGDDKIYTSTPTKRRGEEYCPHCYGCGIKLPSMLHENVISFNPS